MRRIVSPLALVLLAALFVASTDPTPVGPSPFPALPDAASPALRAAHDDAVRRWSSGARPEPSLTLRCRPVRDPAPSCLRVAAPLGGTVRSTDPSGLVHRIDYATDANAWAALTHLVDAPSVESARVRFAGD